MKVICIDASNPKNPAALLPEHDIYEGETYTVCGGYFDKRDGYEYYYLEERQIKPLAGYRAYRFLPLSNIEETIGGRTEVSMPALFVNNLQPEHYEL